MLLDEIRIVWLIERGRVRPPKNLVLKLRIIEVVEEITKTIDQVALCDDHKYGKTDVQNSLDGVKLPSNFGGLLLDLIGGILDEAISGYYEKHAVNRATRPIPLKKL